MKGFLKKIKLILAAAANAAAATARNLKFKQSIIISIWPDVIILVSFIFAVKYIISNEPSSCLGCYSSSSNCNEITSSSQAATSNLITVTAAAATDFDIPSILEYGDVLSPLQNLLNNEIAILLLILIHIFIIIMVLVNKFYVSGSLNLISKLFSNSKLLVKFERYKIIVDKFSNRFINLLLVINIIFILAYILLLLYINIKLSSNLDDFIDVHNDMKKGIILFINSKFLFCLDNTSCLRKLCCYRNSSCSCNSSSNF